MISSRLDLDHLASHDQHLLDSLPVGIVVQNSAGEIISANAAACRILHTPREDLLGQSSEDPVWQGQREDGIAMSGLEHPAMVCLQTGVPQREVVMGLRLSAHPIWVSINCEPLFVSGAPLPYAVVSSFNDISHTHSKHQEQQALATAIEQSPSSVVIVNLDGNIIYANERLCELTGYRREDLIGKNPRLFASGKTPRKNYEALWTAMLSGNEWWGELYNRNRDGHEFVEFAHMVPLRDSNGQVSGYLGIKEDITERKLLGEELDRYRFRLKELVEERTAELLSTQKELEASRHAAEAANEAKSAFLANMSHEIRTPMNAVIALSHLMLQDIAEPKQRERLLKVSSSAQHLLGLINDILDFSKIEAGRFKLENIDFELANVIDMVSHQVEDGIRAKGLDLLVSIDQRLPAFLHGDPLRLGQVLLNFMSNAVKFTRVGRIELAVALIDGKSGEAANDKAANDKASASAAGDPLSGLRVRFSVRDSGEGFDPTIKKRLFHPFEQADATITREHGGTGLGLTICQRIADMMGGRIDADSVPGEGSIFWFELPFERASLQESTRYAADLSHCRALLFSIDAGQGRMLMQLFEGFGMRVQLIDSLRELRPRLLTASEVGMPYDFVVCEMPPAQLVGFCSPETHRMIHKLPLSKPPALLLAAHLEGIAEKHARTLAENFDALLPLPLTASVLHDALLSVISGTEVGMSGGEKNLATDAHLDGMSASSDLRAYAAHRLLIVEDNQLNQEVALDMLQSAGLSAEVADNGRDALILCKSRHYDLILMDMQMPVMDGIAATQAIRQLPGYADVPILAMTANAFEDDRQRCYVAGMNDHIPKPVVPQRLYEALRYWLPPPFFSATSKGLDEGPDEKLDESVPSDLPELPDLPGLDLQIGLRSLGGKRARYRQLLDKFVQQHHQDMPLLRSALAQDDFAEARRIAHGLKGVAGTLGALTVADSALAVERLLKQSGDSTTLPVGLDAKLDSLERHLQDLLQGLTYG